MVNTTGSDDIGGINQSGDNTFGDSKFWFQWIEFGGRPQNLTEAGFDIADGSIRPGTVIYNAGGTDDLDTLATNASASVLGNDVTGDRSQFGFRVTTTLSVENAGNYRFDLLSDDGAILYVDGQRVVDNDDLHSPRTRSGDIDLTEGDHEIVIVYFELRGRNVLEVDIQSDAGGDYPTEIALQDANVRANAADDQISGNGGDDTIDAGTGDDTLDGGDGDDQLTGGDGDDVFIVSDGADVVTDFGAGESGPTDDGDQSNNDFVDLGGFYNAATAGAVNAADPANDFKNGLELLRADAADGTIDGVIDGTDYSAQIGDIDLTLQNGGAAVVGDALTFDNTNVVCFVAGTLIETDAGPRPVEALAVGDRVLTMAGGYEAIRWINARTCGAAELAAHPKLLPIRIAADALGPGVPRADLCVSPQHRVLVRSAIAQRMFGSREVLVAANKLLALPGVTSAAAAREVTYVHFMCDAHQIVYANGAPTETMYSGAEAIRALSPAAREELIAIFPQLAEPDFAEDPAVPIPLGRRQRQLIARHIKNRRAIVSD